MVSCLIFSALVLGTDLLCPFERNFGPLPLGHGAWRIDYVGIALAGRCGRAIGLHVQNGYSRHDLQIDGDRGSLTT